MKFIRYFYIFLVFFGSVGYSQDFLPSFGDVPLYSGFAIDSDSVVSFEVADGRIAEIRGVHSSSESDMVAFYRGVMPSLGWAEQVVSGGGLYFIRDGEALKIDFIGDGQVLFRLSPSV